MALERRGPKTITISYAASCKLYECPSPLLRPLKSLDSPEQSNRKIDIFIEKYQQHGDKFVRMLKCDHLHLSLFSFYVYEVIFTMYIVILKSSLWSILVPCRSSDLS